MINLITEVKKTNDFPKLMQGNGNWIVEVYRHPESEGEYIAIHRVGPYAGNIAIGFGLSGFIDYNEPITIQNA